MSAVEELMRAKLVATPAVTDEVGQRIYPFMAERTASKPYVTYIRVVTDPVNALSGPVGDNHYRIQFDVWGDRQSEVRAAADAIASALAGWSNGASSPTVESCLLVGDHDLPEKPTDGKGKPIRRISLDFSVWTG